MECRISLTQLDEPNTGKLHSIFYPLSFCQISQRSKTSFIGVSLCLLRTKPDDRNEFSHFLSADIE